METKNNYYPPQFEVIQIEAESVFAASAEDFTYDDYDFGGIA